MELLTLQQDGDGGSETQDFQLKVEKVLPDNIEHELDNITEGYSIQDQELGKN